MSNKFARLLNYQQQVHDFLTGPLGLDTEKMPGIHYKIINCEKGVLDGIENPTSTSDKFRDIKYQNDNSRLQLRQQIVDELFTKKQLKNDDKISLGRGGTKPTNPRKRRQAFILIGLASGKSSVASKIAQRYGAFILDSDFAKRKLPEYNKHPWGASLVNSESSMIVFGDEAKTGFESLYQKTIRERYNVIIPKIGAEPDDIVPYCENLKMLDYKVHLTLVYLPKEKATVRALNRLLSTDRYVPLSLIFDSFGNNPALTYFLLKNKQHPCIDSYGIWSTPMYLERNVLFAQIYRKTTLRIFSENKKMS